MRLACEIYKNGVTTGAAMNEDLAALIHEIRPKKIIETGTHLGTGSTKAILNALKGRDDYKLITIEANPHYFNIAYNNLEFYIKQGFVDLRNGLSIPKCLTPIDIDDNYPDEVITDHRNSKEYLKEIAFDVEEDQLFYAMNLFNCEPDLVLLDSAGHLGTIEFHYLMSLAEGSFHLVLDDTLHRKHYNTLNLIKKDSRFTILKESSDKFGYAIVRYDK